MPQRKHTVSLTGIGLPDPELEGMYCMSGETQMRTAFTAIGLAGLLLSACSITGMPDVRVRGIPTPRTPAVIGGATATATPAATLTAAPTAPTVLPPTIAPPTVAPVPATAPPVVEGGVIVEPAPAFPPPHPPHPAPCGQRVVHVVRPHETLYSIAAHHRTTAAEIMRINRIRDPRAVAVGRRLVIIACDAGAPHPPPHHASHRYVVRAGDNLFRIGLRFGVSVAALRAANGLRSNAIRVGQVLVIP
jgi:LysM repeat protein